MKHTCSLGLLSISILLLGCHSVQVNPPTETVTRPAKQTLKQKKLALSQRKKTATQLPEVLGGIVQSDEWIIYKDKEQPERLYLNRMHE